MNLIMFCYNFMRTSNILGFEKMLEAINNWKPDYSKLVCAIKRVIMKMSGSQKEPPLFLSISRSLFFKVACISPDVLQIKL